MDRAIHVFKKLLLVTCNYYIYGIYIFGLQELLVSCVYLVSIAVIFFTRNHFGKPFGYGCFGCSDDVFYCSDFVLVDWLLAIRLITSPLPLL